ncbi:MAG: CHASE3 domain-containing protein [Candidatus Eremiobacteraeota bacterium]|nr:CHASE3 domain-containing protein [Candidatus Eremiobacteraeota bacterium]
MSTWRRTRRLDRTVTRYGLILVAVLTIIIASFASSNLLDAKSRQLDDVRLDARLALQLFVDQATAVDGYDDTDQRQFLAPYNHLQAPLKNLLLSLTRRTADDTVAASAIADFALLHDSWLSSIAHPVVAHPDDPKNITREHFGKKLIDAARADIAKIEQRYAQRYDRIMELKYQLRWFTLCIILLSILAIAITGYVTERKSVRREETLLRTIIDDRDVEALRSEWRTKIIAMLAHDFRSSLSVIRAYSEMLQAMPERRDDEQTYDVMVKTVEDLTAMTEEALLMARMSNNAISLHLRPQRIYEIVAEAAERHRAERAIRIASSDAMVMGDRPYLVRVFDNLISNSVKYSPPATSIDVAISRSGGPDVEIAVTDRGRGIDPSDLPHVFDEFWRAQSTSERSGSGIGLFIVKKIVEAHGGHASIESTPGAGTTVRVLLAGA